ncbi:hypothetical protein ACFSYG_12000 [Leeuwenhoekiella polynyae]|uniref:Outer membrane efflux protein n=1 Tax=Leeuwenhoekiella polynyae TaxID=1550906 RepID=A0A4V1KRQ0_9FLAO|nr:hypothetical protein [Leeuwenhoekiella polynyae]RXG25682.1 hypothetical protein DSM02_849 [Leeuwenhoekiella polynyae]
MRSPAFYTRQITVAKKQLNSLGNIQLSIKQSKILRAYYRDRIIQATENRNAARAANITVIDPIYL